MNSDQKAKLVIAAVLVILVIAYIKCWTPRGPKAVPRYPANRNRLTAGPSLAATEEFFYYNAPRVIADVYDRARRIFQDYNFSIEFEYGFNEVQWEFKFCRDGLDVDLWLKYYYELFPRGGIGYEYKTPTFGPGQKTQCISFLITERTAVSGQISQLNFYLNRDCVPWYVYRLTCCGLFTPMHIPPILVDVRDRDYETLLSLAIDANFNRDKATLLVNWIRNNYYSSLTYGFEQLPFTHALRMYTPDRATTQAYFETFHSDLRIVEEQMYSIAEIVIVFDVYDTRNPVQYSFVLNMQ